MNKQQKYQNWIVSGSLAAIVLPNIIQIRLGSTELLLL